MFLSKFTNSRDNNLNLIRMIATLAVLVSHSFAIALGRADAEPWRDAIGMTPGNIAVDIFFLLSGFLVTASLINRPNLIDFFWARFLRIFPALIIAVAITVFVFGACISSWEFWQYLTSTRIYMYLIKIPLLFFGYGGDLPGVFSHNKLSTTVNNCQQLSMDHCGRLGLR